VPLGERQKEYKERATGKGRATQLSFGRSKNEKREVKRGKKNANSSSLSLSMKTKSARWLPRSLSLSFSQEHIRA
jgi:hypothetical protein